MTCLRVREERMYSKTGCRVAKDRGDGNGKPHSQSVNTNVSKTSQSNPSQERGNGALKERRKDEGKDRGNERDKGRAKLGRFTNGEVKGMPEEEK